LHKAYALLKLNQRNAAIHELRSLVQRHPASPEAMQARERLKGMGERASTRN
jgi:TolA-binding protein